MRASIWLLGAMFAAVPGAALANALTTDDQLRQALAGNTVTGEEDGASFSEYYAPDGRISGESAGVRYSGHWHIAGGQMCVRYLDEHIGKEGFWECSQIDVDGNRVRWSDEEGREFFTLTVGNPGKL